LYDEACCHTQLGELDNALTCLETLLKSRDTGLTFMVQTDWRLDPLRKQPRFHEILKSMHFE